MDKPDSYENKPLINKPPYGIVGCVNLKELPALVNIEIADGYEPIGAPLYYPHDNVWCQAMYKRPQIVRSVEHNINPGAELKRKLAR